MGTPGTRGDGEELLQTREQGNYERHLGKHGNQERSSDLENIEAKKWVK